MSKIAGRVEKLARPLIEEMGLSLWNVEFLHEGGRWVLRILIDSPEGVSIQHCEAVSRALDPVLDEEDPIEQSYVLQVSSAGLERVLKRPSDFERFMGALVEIRLYSPVDGKKEFRGILSGFDGQTVTLDSGVSFPLGKTALVKTVLSL